MKYYIDKLPFSIDKGHPFDMDQDGVLMSKIPYTQEFNYHATAIASYVIKTGDDANLEWLIENMDADGSIYHAFVFPFYPMELGWVGGLAQGLTASALARSGERVLAKLACKSLEVNCMQLGRIHEYPGVEILNGWIYALFGLLDSGLDMLFHDSCAALADRLHLYDMGYWSLYGLYNNYPATEFYHRIHVNQLLKLSEITENKIFSKYAIKWQNNACRRRAHLTKNYRVIRKNGVLGTYNKYKQMKEWKNEDSIVV